MKYNNAQNNFKKTVVGAMVLLDNHETVDAKRFDQCMEDFLFFIASTMDVAGSNNKITLMGDEEKDGTVFSIVISKETVKNG